MTRNDDWEIRVRKSSLGTPGVRQLARRTPPEVIKHVLKETQDSPGEARLSPSKSAYSKAKSSSRERKTRMSKNRRHVVPSSEGGWDVKAPGADRASSHHDTKAEAESRAKDIVRNNGGGEVVIHDRDGRISDSDTVAPGGDPYPPRDRKH